ncbi:bifunctional protein-serine/threonine kinase/phosphatase [Vibrio agarivorans]|uniref:bifunctional protein-serine/threonine kinase/phosphatase n=1 Tax=Vibrio agarivorans TaxID=153622 RepID=UPI002231217A|nr:bifunctional protein-serine/threonine kinase/phosphatase [Vibrio agarivorans]MDN3663712.1 bifunctional protein-serine/threonine kinase/phosphatase [Vibrio agarivorans]
MNSKAAIPPSTLSLSYGGYSDRGRRDENQDAFAVNVPEHHHEITHKGIVACIADGVSCSDSSQLASHTAVMQFISDYYATPYSWSIKQSANKILSSLNNWLFEQGTLHKLSHNSLVTTFTGIILKSNTAHLFHVGDSRIYLLRKGQLRQLTRDHQRINFGKAAYLTRALGMDSALEIDYQAVALKQGDRLFLSTDGVHDFISESALVEHLNTDLYSDNINQGLERLCHQICSQALTNDSKDNTSCLIIDVEHLPEHSITEYQYDLLSRKIPPALAEGHVLEGYRVDKVLHAGSRSHVYQVTELNSGRRFVLKAPSQHDQDNLDVLKLFANEYWVSTQLNSHRIMQMYPSKPNSQFLYQLCEHIEGITLRQWMYDHPTPPLQQVRDIVDEIIKALRTFQRASMVHRDLKPENIMLTSCGQVKIIDFGAVHVSSLNELAQTNDSGKRHEQIPLGAINYIAPEYLDTGEASILSDLFSVAVIGYELLTGHLPYKPTTSQNLQTARHKQWCYRSISQYRYDIPTWIDLALKKATHPKPNQRYQVLSEFVLDLYTPNQTLQKELNDRPLLQRNPITFWKLTTLIATAIALIEFIMLL